MNGPSSEYAPTPEPAPAPKPDKVCKRCGMHYVGPIQAHRDAPIKRGGCIPGPVEGRDLSAEVHGVEVIAAVREDAQHPETDDQ